MGKLVTTLLVRSLLMSVKHFILIRMNSDEYYVSKLDELKGILA